MFEFAFQFLSKPVNFINLVFFSFFRFCKFLNQLCCMTMLGLIVGQQSDGVASSCLAATAGPTVHLADESPSLRMASCTAEGSGAEHRICSFLRYDARSSLWFACSQFVFDYLRFPWVEGSPFGVWTLTFSAAVSAPCDQGRVRLTFLGSLCAMHA